MHACMHTPTHTCTRMDTRTPWGLQQIIPKHGSSKINMLEQDRTTAQEKRRPLTELSPPHPGHLPLAARAWLVEVTGGARLFIHDGWGLENMMVISTAWFAEVSHFMCHYTSKHRQEKQLTHSNQLTLPQITLILRETHFLQLNIKFVL